MSRRNDYDPRELLTILTATSPLPSHPSIEIIRRAVRSLGTYAGLDECHHLIVCDGCGEGSPEHAERYAAYKQRLRMLADAGLFCTKAEIVELSARVGLPGVMLAGARRVRTPFLLVYEHDWEIVRWIDTLRILRTLASCRDVQHIRLNKWRTREAGWDFVIKPDVRRRPVSLVRTSAWSTNPHFTKLSYYRRMVLPLVSERPEGGAQGFEEPLFARLCSDIRTQGFDRAQRKWGVFIYGRHGDQPVVSHLDGRWSRVTVKQEGT